MHPKKAKQLIPEVASSLGLPEDCVTEIVNFYWSEVRRALSSLSEPRIHITNLGDFVIKDWKIDPLIQGLEKWEENNRLKGLQEITARFKTAETLFGLKAIKETIDKEKQRQEFIKNHKRATYDIKRRFTKNMEEPRTDNGGDS